MTEDHSYSDGEPIHGEEVGEVDDPRPAPPTGYFPIDTRSSHPVMALPDAPMALIERAVIAGAGVETIEKLMALQERFEANRARRAFDAAIAAARAEIKPIVKTAEVDFSTSKGRTNYKHETLDAIASQIDPILARHGLSYRFRSRQDAGGVHVTCVIAHREGYSEETTLSGPPDMSGNKNPYQGIGSACSYLQRYTLKLALGLSAAKDNDANSVAGVNGQISPEDFVRLRDLIAEVGVDPSVVCDDFGARSLEQFPAKHLDAAIEKLRITLRKRQGGDRGRNQQQDQQHRAPARPDPAQLSTLKAAIKQAGLAPQVVAEGMGVPAIEDLTLGQWEDALRRVRATIRRNEEAARNAPPPADGPDDGHSHDYSDIPY